MEKYFLLSWKNGKEPLASAFAPKRSKLAQDLISELNGINKLPFELSLVKVDVGKNGLIESNDLSDLKEIWLDYQPNSLAWPLMSERLKSVIEANLKRNEQIDWIECKVKNGSEERTYFILRFNKILDVLDMQKTMFVQGTDHIIKPVFASSKISAYGIFPKPSSHDLWKITSGLYVSDVLKKAIQKEKLTGIDFEKTTVS
ncbi:MAG: hypothetical protein LBR65_01435 [Culturomica sp.]|jgi:hypothetical protein|nr:hypothetical protein [Culturomica sp.]